MNRSPREGGATRAAAAPGTDRILPNKRLKFRRRIISNNAPQHLSIEAIYKSSIGSTKPHRTFRDSFKNWLKIERRTANDLQHIRGCGLLLERFAQFVKQPRVLDGDDGLCGERPQKRKLFIRKRAGRMAHDA